ncbi:MAG: LysR family transcriptional regulator [Planctomycetes bacterium]|nr:LysR family transcriptional regulator [Planctomycetota bacterium]
MEPRFKLWMSSENAEGIFGDGKAAILREVQKHGSLRAAAEAIGMSYRKAWGDLEKAEEALGVVLVERSRGGASGGGATLTRTGKRWLTAYESFRKTVEETVEEEFQRQFAMLLNAS